MGTKRHVVENVDKLPIPDELLDVRQDKKINISDTHDRIGTILSDVRDGTSRHVARYSTDWLKEYYPVAKEAGTRVDNPLNIQTLDAATLQIDVQPDAGYMNEVELIFIDCTNFAAARRLQVSIYDGTNTLPLWDSGAGLLAANTEGLIHPHDTTGLAIFAGTRNNFDIHQGSYLRLTATGLVAAEEIDVITHMLQRDAGGLRT